MKIEDVRIGERRRKDLGNVGELAKSIRRFGLLHPIVVDEEGNLIAGERRLTACGQLGMTHVAVTRVNVDDPLQAELDENECRKDLLPSEAVAVARVVEAKEKPKAAATKAANLKRGTTPPRTENFTVRETGRVADKAAAAAGMSRPTLKKADAVVAAAEEDPDGFGDLVERMDETGKVDPVHKELKRRKEEEASGAAEPEETVVAASPAKPAGPSMDQIELADQIKTAMKGVKHRVGCLMRSDPPASLLNEARAIADEIVRALK